jgi:hypothetical protein
VSNHRTEAFIDDALSVPEHTALVAQNHSTGTQSLTCDDCAEALGSFPSGRWREKHIRQAWQKHLDQLGVS